jgi:hypothetical protein
MTALGKWCVYSHASAGQVFYVGSGQPSRPYRRDGRTARWREHVDAAGEYDVHVHLWTDDQAEAKRIGAELIAKYGPRCNVNRRTGRIFNEQPPNPTTVWRLPQPVKDALEKLAKSDDRIEDFTGALDSASGDMSMSAASSWEGASIEAC